MKIPKPTFGEFIALLTLLLISVPTVWLLWRQTNIAKRAADAAATAANAAKGALEQNKDFSSKSLVQMKEQTRAMNVSAEASKESANVASRALRVSERAYVGVENGSGANFVGGSVGTITLVLKNTGRTPALDCQTLGAAGIIGRNQKIPSPPRTKDDSHGGATLHPGAGFILRSGLDFPNRLSKSEVKGIKAGALRYFFRVELTYRDVFSHTLHKTLVCRQLGTDLVTTIPCPDVADVEN